MASVSRSSSPDLSAESKGMFGTPLDGRLSGAAIMLPWLYLTNGAALIGGELNSEIEKAAHSIFCRTELNHLSMRWNSVPIDGS
jgi:hypothetical protein